MKKAISIVLTVIMLFAVCVPAFAATDISKTDGKGEIIVSTTTTTESGDDAETYSVTIPADTQIAWGTLTTDVSYSVESHLSRNKAVNVTVAGNENGTMKTDPANGEVYTLAYTLDGAVDYTADHPVVYPAATQAVNVLVDELAWNTAVVESYSDILTYTSQIVTVDVAV